MSLSSKLDKAKELAVKRCDEAMVCGRIHRRQIDRVLKYSSIDVEPIEKHLYSENEMIRVYACEIIGKKGNVDKLIDMAISEESNMVLSVISDHIWKNSKGLSRVCYLVDCEDEVLREKIIKMFIKAKRHDCLTPLLFSEDDNVMNQVREYIKNAKKTSI